MLNVQSTLPVGTILQGRYLVQGLLGSSLDGAVYVVKDQYVKPDLFNLLVLKEVVNPSRHKLHQIVLEAMALRLLHHQALPRVYQVIGGGNPDRVYLLMDYIEGPSLERLRVQQPERRFSFPQAMTLMAPIMEAVAYLHRQQPPIIHQNIKPANILVPATSDKTVLVNFGVGKRYNPNATARATPRQLMTGYEAPEQASQAAINRSDIYALGATFYTLLTGFVPLNGSSRTIQLESTGKDPLEPLNRVRPTISLDVAESIHQALSLNSEDRFERVEQFAEALRVDPTWKMSPVEKREFDLALTAASKEPYAPEPSPESSLPTVAEQEEGRRPTEPEAKSEEIKPASAAIVKQDEVRPAPVPVTKSEGIRPAPEPVKLQSGVNPAATSMVPEATTKQLEELVPTVEPAVREEEPKPVPETLVRQAEGRFEAVIEPEGKQEESWLAPEPVTSESLISPAASSSEHESAESQPEEERLPAAQSVVREEEPKPVPETLVRQAEERLTEPLEREEERGPAPEPVTSESVTSPAASRSEHESGASQLEGEGMHAAEAIVREEASGPPPESSTAEPVENAVASRPEPGIEPRAVQEHEDARPVPAARPGRLHSISFRQRRILVSILLLLVLSISLGTALLTSALRPLARGSVSPTPSVVQKNTPSFHTPTPASTSPTPGPAFHLANSYEGTISNLAANVHGNIFLRGIQQQQNTISGSFTGLGINAAFHGSLDASGHIQFKVISPSGSAMFSFDGARQTGGTFGGNYCHIDQHGQCSGEYGLWSVSPAR